MLLFLFAWLSFRGARETSEDRIQKFEIPGLRLAAHPGMT